ncbi:MAG: Asp-tRNA(Asn)/Glu-tRNA(Gln) amidotransferase subunit GatA [Verrucomicrobiales bacterium]|nr:Asp-tRNA(Asn)/Glu-tRNA(Gln) amidotransferase subunit GatA [Verrucomicrobiales bacterium]
MSDALHLESIATLRQRLLRGEIAPADILRCLHREIQERDGRIGAYLHVDLAAALAEAERADLSLPLGGIPIAIKDNINVQGQPTTCASKILAGKFVSPYDATAISRLRAAGAIPFGKTNMDEFAMGSSTENSALRRTANPHDFNCVPGGSSGGSAAAVAAHLAVAALGSDTGGSIREPAAFCGCVGLKPSYGRVSRYGLVAYSSSLDQIGPLCKTVRDAALISNAIFGGDPLDSTALSSAVPDHTGNLEAGVNGLRIGLPKEYFIDGTDPEILTSVKAAIAALEGQGAEIVEVSLPHTEHAIAAYYVIATAEASANLARFDGVRYGHRCAEPGDIIDLYRRSRAEGFGPEVKRRIILGTYVLSSGYYDAYYLKAQKVRTLIMRDFIDAFAKVDVLACPATPTPAFRQGEKTTDPLQMYLEDVFTVAANLAGVCGISVPCGWTAGKPDAPRLPIGLQLLGPALGEATILRVARAWERTAPGT